MVANDRTVDAEGRRAGIGRSRAHSRALQYRCFDELPREIRDFLNDAPIRMCPVQLHEALNSPAPALPERYASFRGAQAVQTYTPEKVMAALRRTVDKWRRMDRHDMEHGEGIWAIGGHE